MSTGSETDGRPKKRVRDRIEETFARYEPKTESVPIPRFDETSRTPDEAARVQAPIVTQTSTGVPGLDPVLEGGFPDRSLMLVLGETGSHYEAFVRQILYHHLLNKGKVAHYLVESLSSDILQDMGRFGWKIEDSVQDGKWVFVNLRTPDLHKLAQLMPKNLSEGFALDVSRDLSNLKTDLLTKVKEDRRTVLELGHLMHEYPLLEILSLILYWRTAVRVHGGVHFALLPIGVHPEPSINALKHLADGVFELHVEEDKRTGGLVLSASKLSSIKTPLKISLKLRGSGLVAETPEKIS